MRESRPWARTAQRDAETSTSRSRPPIGTPLGAAPRRPGGGFLADNEAAISRRPHGSPGIFFFSLSRGICAVCGRGHPNAAWPDGGRTPAQTTQKQIESLLSRQQTPPRLPCAKNWRRKHALIIPRDAMQRGRRDFTEAQLRSPSLHARYA